MFQPFSGKQSRDFKQLQLNNTAKAYRINETNFLAFDGLTPKNEVIEYQKADLSDYTSQSQDIPMQEQKLKDAPILDNNFNKRGVFKFLNEGIGNPVAYGDDYNMDFGGNKPMALGYYNKDKERMEVADYLKKDMKYMNRFKNVKPKEYLKQYEPRRADAIAGIPNINPLMAYRNLQERQQAIHPDTSNYSAQTPKPLNENSRGINDPAPKYNYPTETPRPLKERKKGSMAPLKNYPTETPMPYKERQNCSTMQPLKNYPTNTSQPNMEKQMGKYVNMGKNEKYGMSSVSATPMNNFPNETPYPSSTPQNPNPSDYRPNMNPLNAYNTYGYREGTDWVKNKDPNIEQIPNQDRNYDDENYVGRFNVKKRNKERSFVMSTDDADCPEGSMTVNGECIPVQKLQNNCPEGRILLRGYGCIPDPRPKLQLKENQLGESRIKSEVINKNQEAIDNNEPNLGPMCPPGWNLTTTGTCTPSKEFYKKEKSGGESSPKPSESNSGCGLVVIILGVIVVCFLIWLFMRSSSNDDMGNTYEMNEEIDTFKVKPNFKRMRNTNGRRMNMNNKRSNKRRKTKSMRKKKK